MDTGAQIEALQSLLERLQAEVSQKNRRSAAVASEPNESSDAGHTPAIPPIDSKLPAPQGDRPGSAVDEKLAVAWDEVNRALPGCFPGGGGSASSIDQMARMLTLLPDLLRAFLALEENLHKRLKDLRQVDNPTDKISAFLVELAKIPGLEKTLQSFIRTGRGMNHLRYLLQSLLAWNLAFTTGLYKAITNAPGLIHRELDPSKWPVSSKRDAAVGKHFNESVRKELPLKLGTLLRRSAGEFSAKDYDHLLGVLRHSTRQRPGRAGPG